MSSRQLLAVITVLCGVASVVNVGIVAGGGTPGAFGFGLWVAGPTLCFGAIHLLITRSESKPATTARSAGRWGLGITLSVVTFLAQVIVATDTKSSTAALLYIFAPFWAVAFAAVAWVVCWGVAAVATRPAPRSAPTRAGSTSSAE